VIIIIAIGRRKKGVLSANMIFVRLLVSSWLINYGFGYWIEVSPLQIVLDNAHLSFSALNITRSRYILPNLPHISSHTFGKMEASIEMLPHMAKRAKLGFLHLGGLFSPKLPVCHIFEYSQPDNKANTVYLSQHCLFVSTSRELILLGLTPDINSRDNY
jgi:hypothetical protein